MLFNFVVGNISKVVIFIIKLKKYKTLEGTFREYLCTLVEIEEVNKIEDWIYANGTEEVWIAYIMIPILNNEYINKNNLINIYYYL